MLLIKGTKFVFIVHFNEFLAANDWERNVQPHPEATDCSEALLKRGVHVFVKVHSCGAHNPWAT